MYLKDYKGLVKPNPCKHHYKPKTENWVDHSLRRFTSQLRYQRKEWNSEWIFGISNEPHEEASEYEEELEPRTKYPPKKQPLESFSLDNLCAVEIDLNPELTLHCVHSKGHILLYEVTIQSRNEEPKMMVSVYLSKCNPALQILPSLTIQSIKKNAIKTRSRYDWSKKK